MGQDVNLARKVAAQNVGCVFTYFCGGHKNNFPIWFRGSVKPKYKKFIQQRFYTHKNIKIMCVAYLPFVTNAINKMF